MKDEMPHKLPMPRKLYKILTRQGKKLILIHKECTIWRKENSYYLYIFSDTSIHSNGFTKKEIKKSLNDYFNKRK